MRGTRLLLFDAYFPELGSKKKEDFGKEKLYCCCVCMEHTRPDYVQLSLTGMEERQQQNT